jgi:hypothetical protein
MCAVHHGHDYTRLFLDGKYEFPPSATNWPPKHWMIDLIAMNVMRSRIAIHLVP